MHTHLPISCNIRVTKGRIHRLVPWLKTEIAQLELQRFIAPFFWMESGSSCLDSMGEGQSNLVWVLSSPWGLGLCPSHRMRCWRTTWLFYRGIPTDEQDEGLRTWFLPETKLRLECSYRVYQIPSVLSIK